MFFNDKSELMQLDISRIPENIQHTLSQLGTTFILLTQDN